MENGKEKYGLFTTITMIVGICIGSGIFFKSDNILVATGGSIFLGILVFVLGAVSIIFGGLCMGQLAARTDKAGGAITYYETFGSERLAGAFGWFQIFVYYPTITSVVAWASGIFFCILFNLGDSFLLQMAVGMTFCAISFLYNILSPKFGGLFQNTTTVIKLIPLFLFAVLGMIFGDPLEGFKNVSTSTFAGASWIMAVGPISFSYDGWIVSTSITHEIRKPKRNMPLALIVGPLFILAAYLLYFVGVSSYLSPETIMALGDEHVAVMASQLLGSWGAKAILVFVTISVLGTVNGLVLGYIRLPYSLALRGAFLPFSRQLRKINPKLQMPVNSAIFAFAVSLLWTFVHFVTQHYNLLPNSDISEISIAISYLLYSILYFKVFRLYLKREIKNIFFGIICPLFATLGVLFILGGGMQAKLFPYYAAFCLLVFALSYLLLPSGKKQQKD